MLDEAVFCKRELDEFLDEGAREPSEPPRPESRRSNIWTIEGGSFLTGRLDCCGSASTVVIDGGGDSDWVGLTDVDWLLPLVVDAGASDDVTLLDLCFSYFDSRLLTPPNVTPLEPSSSPVDGFRCGSSLGG